MEIFSISFSSIIEENILCAVQHLMNLISINNRTFLEMSLADLSWFPKSRKIDNK